MSDELQSYDKYVPDELLKEIDDYEKKHRSSKPKARGRYPSNEDIVEAILEITGGRLTKHSIEDLFENVIQYLNDKGFNTSAVTPSRIERLVSSLVKRGAISAELK